MKIMVEINYRTESIHGTLHVLAIHCSIVQCFINKLNKALVSKPPKIVENKAMSGVIPFNVGMTIINHPPVITIDIVCSCMFTIPSHGWFKALLYPHC